MDMDTAPAFKSGHGHRRTEGVNLSAPSSCFARFQALYRVYAMQRIQERPHAWCPCACSRDELLVDYDAELAEGGLLDLLRQAAAHARPATQLLKVTGGVAASERRMSVEAAACMFLEVRRLWPRARLSARHGHAS